MIRCDVCHGLYGGEGEQVRATKAGDVCTGCGNVFELVDAPGLTEALDAPAHLLHWRRPNGIERLERAMRQPKRACWRCVENNPFALASARGYEPELGDVCEYCGAVYDDGIVITEVNHTMLSDGKEHRVPGDVTTRGGWRRPTTIDRLRRAIAKSV